MTQTTTNAAVIQSFARGPEYGAIALPAGEPVQVLAAALSPRVRSQASGAHYTSQGVLPLVPGLDGVGRRADGTRIYFLAANDAFGTMAERTVADARLQVELPERVDATAIAAGMLPAISSWVALTQRAPITRGQRVLILGATGTSGLLAVQVARHLGASEVIAAGRSAAGLAHAKALGADQVFVLSEPGALARAASEVDVVLDYLWGEVTSAVMPALCRHREGEARALHWVLIGSAAGDELALSSVLLRKRNLHLLGSGQGASTTAEMFACAPAIVAAFAAGVLTVDRRCVPLADVATAWASAGDRVVFVP